MYIEKENYYYIEEFYNNNVGAIFTKKSVGDFSDKNLANLEKNHIGKFISKFKKNENIFYAKQTHSTNIKIITKEDEGGMYENIDGFITNRKDVIIITKYADCLPIFFMDKKENVIAVIHSGWKGSFEGIQTKAIELMEKEYKCDKENIICGLGIGIGKCCYEVAEEFYEKFLNKYGNEMLKGCFEFREGKVYFDNQQFNVNILQKTGIKKENIILSTECTYCSGKFYSYRKNKNDQGRNAAIIFFK